MFKNNLKIAWRAFAKNKISSFINTGGLALGMAVAILIGLYIYDEFSFNKSFRHYDRIAMVMSKWKLSDRANTSQSMALGNTLKNAYRGDFDRVVISSGAEGHVLAFGDKKFSQQGKFMQPEGAEMFSFQMLEGSRAGLKSPNSIMLAASLAKKLFGNTNPIGKVLKMDNQLNLDVTGVYEDFPENTDFKGLAFFSQMDAYMSLNGFLVNKQGDWGNLWATIYVQLSPRANLDRVSAKIGSIKSGHVSQEEMAAGPSVFLHPMSKWHLFSAFGMGGVSIESVAMHTIWLYSIIGAFVLLLACINFMNLSTARSEKRAKEVGIRKAIGSVRSQLIAQFFSESLLTAAFAFIMAIFMVLLVLPWFNALSGKDLSLVWTTPYFWLASIVFTVFTGLIAGAYPALYLSSFNAVKVLKGPFRAGRFAALPRKVLVVLQFAVSITLIIGTVVVYRQVAFAKDRPVGYDREGLVEAPVNDPNFKAFDVLENELKNSGAAVQVAESTSPLTAINSSNSGLQWTGKDVAFKDQFGTLAVTPAYGKTVGWKFLDGRDFSKDRTDSGGFVINEAAVKYMGLKNPVGQVMQWPRFMAKNFRILGVVKDMVMNSPFDPAYPTVFFLSPDDPKLWVLVKLNPRLSASASLPKVAAVFNKLMPAVPFAYQFSDDDYAAKFAAEERMGKFAIFFAVLAILISCLGLFGLTSFVAEQRTKELGIRKVLGASVLNLWGMLSREFVLLVAASFLTAVPVAFYLMHAWLQKYQYRSELSWWIFAATGTGAMIIALITVSFQSIRAALMNPVKSLKME